MSCIRSWYAMKAQATSFVGCRATNLAQHRVGTDSLGGTENVWQPNTGLSIQWSLSKCILIKFTFPCSLQRHLFFRE